MGLLLSGINPHVNTLTLQMYMVVSHIMAKYTRGSFTSFVKNRIFTPLRMSSSTYSVNTAVGSGKFTQTWSSNGRRIPTWITEDSVELAAGPGGVISSAVDMVRPWEFIAHAMLTGQS
jgi:CubicO group peptidase (beta-lactamase class C family)